MLLLPCSPLSPKLTETDFVVAVAASTVKLSRTFLQFSSEWLLICIRMMVSPG